MNLPVSPDAPADFGPAYLLPRERRAYLARALFIEWTECAGMGPAGTIGPAELAMRTFLAARSRKDALLPVL